MSLPSLIEMSGHKKEGCETSLVLQWLRLCASTIGGTGLIPGQGTKDPACHMAVVKKKRRLCKKTEAKYIIKFQFGLKSE